MTKTYSISRQDLQAKKYRANSVITSGSPPAKRNTEHLAKVLRLLQQK